MKSHIKSLLALLLSAVLLLAGCGAPGSSSSPPSSFGEETGDARPLLWKAEDSGGGCVYLLGSIHVGEKSMYPLPDYVMDAFEASDALAVECDIVAYEKDARLMAEVSEQMLYSDGSTVDEHIPADLYEEMVDFISTYSFYIPAYDYYNLGAWNSLCSSALGSLTGLDARYGVDRHLLTEAAKADKEILEIESVQEQMELMCGFPDELNEYMIRAIVENPQLNAVQEKQLFRGWKEGNEALLEKLCIITDEQIEATGELAEEMRAYRDAMYTERNRVMAEAAAGYLSQGRRVFLTVGTAHMLGEDGVINRLREAGYRVELVTPQQTDRLAA